MTELVLAAALLTAQPETIILHGGDADLAAELAARPEARTWTVHFASPSPAEETENRAQALAQAGEAAYQNLLFEEALPKLKEAVEAYEASAMRVEDYPVYLRAVVNLALLHEALGDEVNRDLVLDRIVRLQPDASFLDERYPPAFREQLAGRLSRLPAKRGALRVESSPSGAAIWLNGRLRGETPVTVNDLPGGEHTVELRLDDYVPVRKVVTVQAGFGIGAEATPDLFEVHLTPAVGREAQAALAVLAKKRRPGETQTRTLQASQEKAGRTYGVYASAATDAVVVALLPTAGAWKHRSFPVEALDVPPLRKHIVDFLVASIRPPAPKPAIAAPIVKAPVENRLTAASPSAKATPEFREEKEGTNWWLWTGLGALVAGGATAAILASQSPAEEPQTGTAVITWK